MHKGLGHAAIPVSPLMPHWLAQPRSLPFTLSMDVFTDSSTWLAGPEDSSGNAADGADYEGSEAAPDAEMMKSESLSTAAAAAIAARAAAAARLREEEQKRRVLEEEAVGAHPFNAIPCPALSQSEQAELLRPP